MRWIFKNEEHVNALTHGLGAVLAVSALVILTVFASLNGNVWHVVSFSIFGATMVILYLSSTLYHSVNRPPVKNFFRKLDHMSIYLLIAGTYTPFCLALLQGWIGWTLFGIIWGATLIGIILKAFFTGKKEFLSTVLYLVMGWAGVFVFHSLYELMTPAGFTFLVLGGVFYSVGTIFFLKDRIQYFHGIWHLFVLAGSTFHFFSVMSMVF
jgi:hemolysin III